MSNEISFALYNVTFYPTKTLFLLDVAQLCNENSEINPNNSRIIIKPTFVHYTSIITPKKIIRKPELYLDITMKRERKKKKGLFDVYTAAVWINNNVNINSRQIKKIQIE